MENESLFVMRKILFHILFINEYIKVGIVYY